MKRPGRALRLMLLAYPAAFRRRYGAEMLRCIQDQRRYQEADPVRLALRVAGDVLLTAPRLRMETLMTRTIAITIAVGLTLLLSLLVWPVALTVVPMLVLLAAFSRRHDQPIAAGDAPRSRWLRHILRGVGALSVSGAVLVLSGGGELSEPLWAIWALSFVSGVTLVILGLVTLCSQPSPRRVA